MNPPAESGARPNRRPRPDLDRVLTDLLLQGHADIREEARRADARISNLLALVGVLAAAVALVAVHSRLPATVITLWLAAGAFAGAFLRLLLAVVPAADDTAATRYASTTPATLLRETEADVRSGTTTTYHRADRLHCHAEIVQRTHRALRTAVGLVLLGCTGLAVASLLILLGGAR
ncbi:hypothetical protein [Amycolatopsis sp. NPDC058986]|uniref:hypothetical protein n=1 Tax=unclassified Amycolatopsis TaxID=2618356 RepID=UPI00366DEB0A